MSELIILLVSYTLLATVLLILMFAYIIYLRKHRCNSLNCPKCESNQINLEQGVMKNNNENEIAPTTVSNEPNCEIIDTVEYETVLEDLTYESENNRERTRTWSPKTDEKAFRSLMSEFKNRMDNKNGDQSSQKEHVPKLGNNAEIQCNLYEEIRWSVRMSRYDEVSESSKKSSYATFLSLPKRKKNVAMNDKEITVIQTIGSTDHLQFFKESSVEDNTREGSYLEPKTFIPKENCPENLRSLCNIQVLIKEGEKPPLLPKKRRIYLELIGEPV